MREYGIELRCVGFVEISREFVFACEQHLFSVVEFYFKGYKQVSVVVGEVRRSVFAAGLVGGDELIVDVGGNNCFEESLAVLYFPGYVEGTFGALAGRQYR